VGDVTPRKRIRKPASVRGWLSPAEAAEMLQVDRSTVRRWINAGELPAIRTRPGGGQFRLDPADVERFAAARQVRPNLKEDQTQAKPTP
jgi:excisionase family DNA binding protein